MELVKMFCCFLTLQSGGVIIGQIEICFGIAWTCISIAQYNSEYDVADVPNLARDAVFSYHASSLLVLSLDLFAAVLRIVSSVFLMIGSCMQLWKYVVQWLSCFVLIVFIHSTCLVISIHNPSEEEATYVWPVIRTIEICLILYFWICMLSFASKIQKSPIG